MSIPEDSSDAPREVEESEYLFSGGQLEELDQLSKLSPNFIGIRNHILLQKNYWLNFVNSDSPFEYLQRPFESGTLKLYFYDLIKIHSLKIVVKKKI